MFETTFAGRASKKFPSVGEKRALDFSLIAPICGMRLVETLVGRTRAVHVYVQYSLKSEFAGIFELGFYKEFPQTLLANVIHNASV